LPEKSTVILNRSDVDDLPVSRAARNDPAQTWVEDRGYTTLMSELGLELTHISGVEAVAEHVLARLGASFNLVWAALSLHTTAGGRLFRWGDCSAADLAPKFGGVSSAPDSLRFIGDGSAQITLLLAGGINLGELMVGPRRSGAGWSDADRSLLVAIVPLLALSLQRVELLAELEDQAVALGERERELTALSRQLMRAQEEERARIAQELHDDPLQRAILLSRRLALAADSPEIRRWRTAVTEIGDGLQAICAGLRPRVLDDFGLVAGLEWLIESLQAQGDTVIQLAAETTDGTAFGRLASDLELALFRIAQESLNNCLKHADATRIIVILWREGPLIRLSVSDNGRGCGELQHHESARLRLGMVGMAERVRPWGGRVQMSPGSNGGTQVVAELTLGNETHAA
jgi:signal transduction histidine kinase